MSQTGLEGTLLPETLLRFAGVLQLSTMEKEAAPAEDYVALYRRAFHEFGTIALWNKAFLEDPEPGHAIVIASALRIEGDMNARRLAERIEAACRAAVER